MLSTFWLFCFKNNNRKHLVAITANVGFLLFKKEQELYLNSGTLNTF